MRNDKEKFKIISYFLIPVFAFSFFIFNLVLAEISPIEERQALEEELKKLEAKIAHYDQQIQKTEKEKRTLQNEIRILRNRIRKLDLQIYQSNIIIKDLDLQIRETKDSIKKTSSEIDEIKERLAAVLRTIYEQETRPLIEILLTEGISEFFYNLTALEALNVKNREFLENIRALKSYLEDQKEVLDEEKTDLERVVTIQILQKEEEARAKKQQGHLLRLTEAEYQRYLREKKDVERRAAEIRARLLELIGVPEAPTFGEALDLAEWVQGLTGVRPAFLLAIITQESHLGRNVGQCYLPRDPAENKKRRIMHPTRDVPPFLKITQELGRDPYNTLVSCPMAFGWGGAMGPAQFIPSTWMNRRPILEQYVEGIPNPWNIRHAFLASALYLRDLGAAQNERRAALRYFAGGNWANPRFAFYGDLVVARTNCLQIFIDYGTMTERCERLIFIPK